MAQLVVLNLEAAVKDRLRSLAARHGRSMEEEIRDILRQARGRGPRKINRHRAGQSDCPPLRRS